MIHRALDSSLLKVIIFLRLMKCIYNNTIGNIVFRDERLELSFQDQIKDKDVHFHHFNIVLKVLANTIYTKKNK